jgi:uncharacterized membrane protein YfcA
VPTRSSVAGRAFLIGAPIGILGGLIGLGGAEFRLPALKAVFGYPANRAVPVNLAVSLFTLLASLAIRFPSTGFTPLEALASVLLGLIAGSLVGAYWGAGYASRVSVHRLERLILVLLVAIGLLLMGEAFLPWKSVGIGGGAAVRVPVAILLGGGIGVVSSLLGVAGGELIIPTLILVFGADIKVAGTASVIVSLPQVSLALLRYALRKALPDRADASAVVLPMGAGSILGALAGGLLVPYVSGPGLKLGLGVLLIASAVKVFRSSSPAKSSAA